MFEWKEVKSLFVSFIVIVVVPPKLFLSLCVHEFYFMPHFGLFAHFISCHILNCMHFISWYVGKDCPDISSGSHRCILFHAVPSLFSQLQCILFHAVASVRSWRRIALMHFVSYGAWFILVGIDAFYFMRRIALSVRVDAFCFVWRDLLCFIFNWSPKGTRPTKS